MNVKRANSSECFIPINSVSSSALVFMLPLSLQTTLGDLCAEIREDEPMPEKLCLFLKLPVGTKW